jgi:hypothetical protein
MLATNKSQAHQGLLGARSECIPQGPRLKQALPPLLLSRPF